jgi:uncharacterized membrane protein YcaP (DUF421 family)
MESVLRGAAVYFFLLVVLRLVGRRALSEITTFDFVLVLIIGEATQQALLGEDFSATNAFLVILTLVVIDLLMTVLQERFPAFERAVTGVPVIVVVDGRPLRELMRKARIDDKDVMEAARQSHGLDRMEQIKYAVLERHGGISIVPKQR